MKLVRWLEHRTGIGTALRSFLAEEIPASSGWPQVFGSVALFLFLTQAVTGILLAFNYAPTPGEAYNSLQYIITQVSGGRMIHGLHHWGASMMVVIVVLHMTQVFLRGAYKKPREMTWLAGVALLLITFAFGLTGYLLPWDNRAYWGTVVTTRIASQAPVLGSYLERLMGAESGVGAVTFARFYALHTLLLPAIACLLIGFHVYLVRRHGIAPAPLETAPKQQFFPGQVFKDACAMFAAFILLFLLAAIVRAPLERLADPTDATANPRPEWYFLFLFQTLKAFKGASEPVGSVLLPTAAVLALFAVPFVDRTRLKRVTERTVAIGVVVLAASAWAALTAAAVLATPHAERGLAAGRITAPAWSRMAPEELVGFGYFRSARCSDCHNLTDGEPKVGPNLAELGPIRPSEERLAHYRNPIGTGDGAATPVARLAARQLDTLSIFLANLTPENARAFSSAPPEAVAGARIFVSNLCGTCHKINGSGGSTGPPLNGLAHRRTKAWVAQHLKDPASQTPNTLMPAFQLSSPDRDLLISYLFSLPGT